MRNIDYIVLHTTDGEWGTVESIRHFHTVLRVPPFADIGYHYLITNAFPTFESLHDKRPNPLHDGVCHAGRDPDNDGDVDEHVGAHAFGWNKRSLGVALVGRGGIFTGQQLQEALRLCRDLCHQHEIPYKNVIGHYETGANKTCPDIDMDYFRELLAE